MKVVLVSSNLRSQFPAVFPNATAALSAYLRQQGHEVTSLHALRRRELRRLPALLRSFQPDVVGISAYTCESPLFADVARVAKAWRPDVPVLAGGLHAIVAPDEVIATPGVDAVCTGEGELAFAEYLDRLARGDDPTATRGFRFRANGEVVANPPHRFVQDLDSLPLPDLGVADLQRVINANNGVVTVMLSRGCPWHCTFCCNRDLRHASEGTYVRLHGVERAMDSLAALATRARFRGINFRDDTFTWNRKWAHAILAAYRERFQWPFDIFSRVDCLDEDIIDALAGAGCQHVFLGLDSGNDFIRNDVLKKRQRNEDLLRVVPLLRRAGITPVISNIVGLPHETPARFRDTVEINKQLHTDKVVFSAAFGACPKIWVYSPWPGTDLYRECVDQGWVAERPEGKKVYRQSPLRMPAFPPAEIDRQFRTFRYQVYKDRFPVRARLFLIYDSAWFQALFERVPLSAIGWVRAVMLRIMNLRLRRGPTPVRGGDWQC